MRAHGQNASEDGTHNILIWRPRHHQVRKLRPHLKVRFVPHRPHPVDSIEMRKPVDGVELRQQLLAALQKNPLPAHPLEPLAQRRKGRQVHLHTWDRPSVNLEGGR